jgi:DNA polymerase III subunit delta'
LEEPPRRTLFILVTRSRGALLPTIRSRCRSLDLEPLSAEEAATVVAAVAPALAGKQVGDLAMAICGGSPRRLIELELSGAEELYRLMLQAIEGGDRSAQTALSARAADPTTFRQFVDLFEDYLSRRVRGEPVPAAEPRRTGAPLVTWANLWEKAALRGQEVEEYNLDRRQYVLDLLETAAAALHRFADPHRA